MSVSFIDLLQRLVRLLSITVSASMCTVMSHRDINKGLGKCRRLEQKNSCYLTREETELNALLLKQQNHEDGCC